MIDLNDLIARYDTFFIDQFGVLRDDRAGYDGAAEGLKALKAAGKKVVILSNSGRSGDYNAKRLATLGFAPDSFDHFLTSGDVALTLLTSVDAPVTLHAGARCLTVSSGGDTNLADRLGLVSVGTADGIELVIISGSEAETIPMERYADLLRPAAAAKVPCICTNPDIQKLANGTLVPAAGAIADLYEQLGGTVIRVGKPFAQMYAQALARCGDPDPSTVVCIGDSIEHDIAGATGAGLASVLVRTGINAGLSEQQLTQALAAENYTAALMTAFRPA